MTENKYTALALNGVTYHKDDLRSRAAIIGSQPELPDWIKAIWSFIDRWVDDKLDYIEMKTSGSTGKPKLIRHSKAHMINSAKMTASFFRLSAGQNALLCMSPEYIGGMMMIVRAFVGQLNLIAVAPSGNPLVNITEDQNIHFAAMVPMQVFKILMESDETSLHKLQKIDQLLIGGGPISPALEERLIQSKVNAFSSYGMTETISHIAVQKIEIGIDSNRYEVLGDIQISQDDRSCLVINAPKLSADKIVTNDVIKKIDHKHFQWLGRYDRVINSGGIKIFPEQLEKKLDPFIEERFFIASRIDAKFGEVIVLVLERDGISEAAAHKLKSSIKASLSNFEVPKQVLAIKTFSKTASGKVDRKNTLQQLKSR